MNLFAANLSFSSLAACQLIIALTLCVASLWVAKFGDWARLTKRSTTYVWHATIAIVVALWSLKATLAGGFTFHLRTMTGRTLVLGAPLALLS